MEVKSNMAGIIIEIMVSVGDKVSADQDLVCMESMKMQMFLSSPSDGVVKEIRVSEGDFVNEGDVILLLE
jgi:acetyl-CoA carboxylase biotin carboxyl carrier protein